MHTLIGRVLLVAAVSVWSLWCPAQQQTPARNRKPVKSTSAKAATAPGMTKEFRKSARATIDAYRIAMHRYAEDNVDAFDEKPKISADSLLGQAEIDASSEGDKLAYANLKKLSLLASMVQTYVHSRQLAAELVRSAEGLSEQGEADARREYQEEQARVDKEQKEAEGCADYLYKMFGGESYTGAGPCGEK